MCGIAGYSLSLRSDVDRTLAAQALLAGIADRGADAVGYAYRGGQRRVSGGHEAAHAREPPARAHLGAGARDRAPHPRARLHEGPSLDPGQQPPGPPRPGRRDPQRDHPQRRRAARSPLLRPIRAADDRRLGGDLRPRRTLAERSARARGARRLDGDRLARPARAGNASSPPAASVGRSGSAAAATRSSSPPPGPRSRSSRSTRACG